MKTAGEIITSMCYTWRHDYGLIKQTGDTTDVISSGMYPEEREALWNAMAQIFDKDIAPYMEFKKVPQENDGVHRINDIIHQVPGLRYDCSVGNFECYRKDLYDFALLIVKECAEVALKEDHDPSDCILKHFGVER